MQPSQPLHAPPALFDGDVLLLLADVLVGDLSCPVNVYNLAAVCKVFHFVLADTLQTIRHDCAALSRLLATVCDVEDRRLFPDHIAIHRLSNRQLAQLEELECLGFARYQMYDDEHWRSLDRLLVTICPMANLKTLRLYDMDISDTGLTSLSDAFKINLLATVTNLNLSRNNVGEAGMHALSSAIAMGSMANLTELNLANNIIGNVGLQAFAKTIGKGSMANLVGLSFASNRIGDAGVIELLRAIAIAHMANLGFLGLGYNNISDAGIISLSDAIGESSLFSCVAIDVAIDVMENPGNAAPLNAACEKRGIFCLF